MYNECIFWWWIKLGVWEFVFFYVWVLLFYWVWWENVCVCFIDIWFVLFRIILFFVFDVRNVYVWLFLLVLGICFVLCELVFDGCWFWNRFLVVVWGVFWEMFLFCMLCRLVVVCLCCNFWIICVIWFFGWVWDGVLFLFRDLIGVWCVLLVI